MMSFKILCRLLDYPVIALLNLGLGTQPEYIYHHQIDRALRLASTAVAAAIVVAFLLIGGGMYFDRRVNGLMACLMWVGLAFMLSVFPYPHYLDLERVAKEAFKYWHSDPQKALIRGILVVMFMVGAIGLLLYQIVTISSSYRFY
jgi:hypothetical protein